MVNIQINVMSSHHPMYAVTPSNSNNALCEIFVGLIMQYHYVGLDKISINSEQNAPNIDPVSNPQSENDELDDATIEEGDEHRIQISGAPLASMMCVENPESVREIICVAPAEGEKPLNFMTDPNFEAICLIRKNQAIILLFNISLDVMSLFIMLHQHLNHL